MISAAAPHQEERLTPQVVTELLSLPDLAPAGRPELDRKSTRLNSSHLKLSRMPSSA